MSKPTKRNVKQNECTEVSIRVPLAMAALSPESDRRLYQLDVGSLNDDEGRVIPAMLAGGVLIGRTIETDDGRPPRPIATYRDTIHMLLQDIASAAARQGGEGAEAGITTCSILVPLKLSLLDRYSDRRVYHVKLHRLTATEGRLLYALLLGLTNGGKTYSRASVDRPVQSFTDAMRWVLQQISLAAANEPQAIV